MTAAARRKTYPITKTSLTHILHLYLSRYMMCKLMQTGKDLSICSDHYNNTPSHCSVLYLQIGHFILLHSIESHFISNVDDLCANVYWLAIHSHLFRSKVLAFEIKQANPWSIKGYDFWSKSCMKLFYFFKSSSQSVRFLG